MGRRATIVAALVFSSALAGHGASAGPPFLPDDPTPVDLGHWELYPIVPAAAGAGYLT